MASMLVALSSKTALGHCLVKVARQKKLINSLLVFSTHIARATRLPLHFLEMFWNVRYMPFPTIPLSFLSTSLGNLAIECTAESNVWYPACRARTTQESWGIYGQYGQSPCRVTGHFGTPMELGPKGYGSLWTKGSIPRWAGTMSLCGSCISSLRV